MKVCFCLSRLLAFCGTIYLNTEIGFHSLTLFFFFHQNIDRSNFSLVKPDIYSLPKPKKNSPAVLSYRESSLMLLSYHIHRFLTPDSAMEKHVLFADWEREEIKHQEQILNVKLVFLPSSVTCDPHCKKYLFLICFTSPMFSVSFTSPYLCK